MAVSLVGADPGGGNVTNITDVIWPTVEAGDVAILGWLGQNTSTQTASEFTAIDSVDGDSGASRMSLKYRICNGSEDGGTVSLVGSAANRQCAVLAVWRGLHATSPIDTYAVRDESVSGTTHANPQVTTGFADCVIATLIGERASTGTTGWTAPSGYTERADSTTLATGTGGTICALADDGLATSRPAGTNVTPPVWTSTSGFATANILTWTVSLRPLSADRPPRLIAAMSVPIHRAASW